MKSLPKSARKLSLSRETIRSLTAPALAGAVGGLPNTTVNPVPPDPASNNCATDVCASAACGGGGGGASWTCKSGQICNGANGTNGTV